MVSGMSEIPTALHKARALQRHLYGAAHRTLSEVCLSDREAWELIDWYKATNMNYAPPEDQAMFDADVAQARATRDPWLVLSGFQLLGFTVVPLNTEVH